nr:MAG TPA: Transcription initiation factor IIA subunit, TFIIA, Transcription, single chain.38A [Caudoviricetes sp.]
MLHKNRKMSQNEIDEIYEDFVVEIAIKVAKKVKGKVFYGYASIENMWYIIIKTRELGEKRFFLDTLDYDMLTGVSSKEISDNIVKFYRSLIERRFLI